MPPVCKLVHLSSLFGRISLYSGGVTINKPKFWGGPLEPLFIWVVMTDLCALLPFVKSAAKAHIPPNPVQSASSLNASKVHITVVKAAFDRVSVDTSRTSVMGSG